MVFKLQNWPQKKYASFIHNVESFKNFITLHFKAIKTRLLRLINKFVKTNFVTCQTEFRLADDVDTAFLALSNSVFVFPFKDTQPNVNFTKYLRSEY